MSGYIDKLRDHEFDGIQEFDNYLPKWWLWSFYLACIFAAIYWVYYHGSGFGTSARLDYMTLKAEADAKAVEGKPVTKELLETFAAKSSSIALGKRIFEGKCAQCHSADGSGGTGPNLTDNAWINGGSIEDIYRTVSKGSPNDLQMVAWEKTLKRAGTMQVVAYVMTLKNTNRPGNAPQGTVEK